MMQYGHDLATLTWYGQNPHFIQWQTRPSQEPAHLGRGVLSHVSHMAGRAQLAILVNWVEASPRPSAKLTTLPSRYRFGVVS